MADADFPTLHGHCVDLRPLAVGDAEVTLGWRTGERARLLNAGATDVEQQRSWIARRPRSEQNYVIELKSGDPVGMVSLIAINHVHRNAEPSRFLIGEEERVRGLPVAADALSLLYADAFDRLGLERLYGIVVDTNERMLKWHIYLGMKEEGRMRRHFRFGDAWHDGVMVGLLEEDYRRVTVPKMRALIALSR